MPEIIVLRDDTEIARVRLSRDEISVGRLTSHQIVIDSAKASRTHARITLRGDHYVIEDCGSANGMFLGDERVQEHTFKAGDEIRIADHFLVYKQAEGSVIVPSSDLDKAPWLLSGSGSDAPETTNWQPCTIYSL